MGVPILRIRDKNGNVVTVPAIKGDKGDSYVLTEADKKEIASMVEGSGGTTDMDNYYTKEETNAIVGDIETLLGGI